MVAECSPNGTEYALTECEDGFYCDEGECAEYVCIPNELTCDENVIRRCNNEGLGYVGSGTPCDDGQRCLGGECICDIQSCEEGCCEDGVCILIVGQDQLRCGNNGNLCTSCGDSGDCINGSCSCNSDTCDGCCQDNTCIAFEYQYSDVCGRYGGECISCLSQGIYCLSGRCQIPDPCENNSDCGDGYFCDILADPYQDFRIRPGCYPVINEGGLEIGSECSFNSQCESNFCLDSGVCFGICENHLDCPEGLNCYQNVLGLLFDNDTQLNTSDDHVDSAPGCLPYIGSGNFCSSDSDCLNTEFCDYVKNRTWEAWEYRCFLKHGDVPTLGRCNQDDDCQSGDCGLVDRQGNSYCTGVCLDDFDCPNSCGEFDFIINWRSIFCSSNTDCRPEQTCVDGICDPDFSGDNVSAPVRLCDD